MVVHTLKCADGDLQVEVDNFIRLFPILSESSATVSFTMRALDFARGFLRSFAIIPKEFLPLLTSFGFLYPENGLDDTYEWYSVIAFYISMKCAPYVAFIMKTFQLTRATKHKDADKYFAIRRILRANNIPDFVQLSDNSHLANIIIVAILLGDEKMLELVYHPLTNVIGNRAVIRAYAYSGKISPLEQHRRYITSEDYAWFACRGHIDGLKKMDAKDGRGWAKALMFAITCKQPEAAKFIIQKCEDHMFHYMTKWERQSHPITRETDIGALIETCERENFSALALVDATLPLTYVDKEIRGVVKKHSTNHKHSPLNQIQHIMVIN